MRPIVLGTESEELNTLPANREWMVKGALFLFTVR